MGQSHEAQKRRAAPAKRGKGQPIPKTQYKSPLTRVHGSQDESVTIAERESSHRLQQRRDLAEVIGRDEPLAAAHSASISSYPGAGRGWVGDHGDTMRASKAGGYHGQDNTPSARSPACTGNRKCPCGTRPQTCAAALRRSG